MEMTCEELQEILRLHDLWTKNEKGGVRAKLSYANLSGADLRGANLRGAGLHGANLFGTKNLSVVSAGPFGRDDRITYYKYLIDEVDCGCFCGTLEEFAAKVEETHKDDPVYLAEYRAAVVFFRAVAEARRPGERVGVREAGR